MFTRLPARGTPCSRAGGSPFPAHARPTPHPVESRRSVAARAMRNPDFARSPATLSTPVSRALEKGETVSDQEILTSFGVLHRLRSSASGCRAPRGDPLQLRSPARPLAGPRAPAREALRFPHTLAPHRTPWTRAAVTPPTSPLPGLGEGPGVREESARNPSPAVAPHLVECPGNGCRGFRGQVAEGVTPERDAVQD